MVWPVCRISHHRRENEPLLSPSNSNNKYLLSALPVSGAVLHTCGHASLTPLLVLRSRLLLLSHFEGEAMEAQRGQVMCPGFIIVSGGGGIRTGLSGPELMLLLTMLRCSDCKDQGSLLPVPGSVLGESHSLFHLIFATTLRQRDY